MLSLLSLCLCGGVADDWSSNEVQKFLYLSQAFDMSHATEGMLDCRPYHLFKSCPPLTRIQQISALR